MVKNILISLIALVILIFLLGRLNIIPPFGKWFHAKSPVISNTPILIKEINELAQLMTYAAYDEVVVDSIKADPKKVAVRTLTGLPLYPLEPLYERIVLIAKGKVIAGTDLKKISEKNIYLRKDSISLEVPHATILETIVNPSDFETFSETGHWSGEEVSLVKASARNLMESRALNNHILEKADEQTRKLMEEMLRALGFRRIVISFSEL